jgi:hypothetical protein
LQWFNDLNFSDSLRPRDASHQSARARTASRRAAAISHPRGPVMLDFRPAGIQTFAL